MFFVCLQFTACLLNIKSMDMSCKTNEAGCPCAFVSIFGAILYRPVNGIEQSVSVLALGARSPEFPPGFRKLN